MSCKHQIPTSYNTYNLASCSFCLLESKSYYGFNPEIYNFAYKLYEEAAHLNYTSGKPTYVNMIVFKDIDVFNMYYKLAKFEIRKKKIKSIL